MAVVHLRFEIPAAGGAFLPASGTLRFTPTARRVIAGTPDTVVLPAAFQVQLVAGVADVTLAATTGAWVWQVDEYLIGVPARTVYVSVGAGMEYDYTDLVTVDPATLLPAATPEPAWVAMANSTVTTGAVTGDNLILTRTDGTTVNAGNVRGAAGGAGPANTLSVGTVTTGAAGSSAAATITGAAPAQTLNLTIPRGADGTGGSGGTVTFTTLTSAGQAVTIPAGNVAGLALTQDATGGRTVTWPSGIRWDGGTVPTLSTAVGATDVFTFILVSAGQWLGKKDGSHPAPADTTAPSAVTGLTAGTATATTIPLSWTAATDNVGIAGYEYSTNGTSYTATGSTGTMYTVTGLTASTSYTIYVRAYDAAGNRGAAASVVKSTAAASGPQPGDVLTSDGFTGANVASLNGRVTDLALGGSALTWTASATLGITANAMAQTSGSPTGGSGSLTLAATTENIQLDFNLAAKPVGANIDVYLYAGGTIAAIIRLSPAGAHEVMTSGFGGTGFTITGGAGAVRLIIKGTAMSGFLPNNEGTSTNGTATNTAVFQYSKIEWQSGTATGFSIDDVKVSIPV